MYKNSLKNIVQCVTVNTTVSEEKFFKYEVPQGTMLKPLLFNIHINDFFIIGTIVDDTDYRDNWNYLIRVHRT